MIATTGTIEISRDDLGAVLDGTAAPAVGEAIADIRGAERLSALLAAPGSLRRVDLWIAGNVAVVHGYVERPDIAAPATVIRGPGAAAAAIAELIARRGGEAGDPTLRSGGQVADLISTVVGSPTETIRAAVVGRGTDGEVSSSGLVVVQDRRTRWCEVGPGRAIDLRDGCFAELWARVARLIHR